MTKDTRVQALAAVVLAACLAVSGVLAVNLTGMAGAARMTYTDVATEGQPVEQTIGIALGAFRGLFVNFLWIRANDMKEAGKFFDAINLASTITKLQPRFPRVWVFHAWNMAYNISVTTETPEERWAWVNAGIELLRDQGIPANPNDMLIHKELGWIFLHKIGGFTDDANNYYKRKLAQEWTVVLGPPPRKSGADRDRAKAIQKYVDWLTPLMDAPQSLEDCIKQEPSVQGLLDRLKSDVGVTLSSADEAIIFLGQYEKIRAVNTSILKSEWEKNMGPRSKAFAALVSDPAYDAAFKALALHLRKRLIVDRYHMDPARMIRYTQKYGPIDWRHHAAHGLYWSEKGVEAGEAHVSLENKADFDFVNTDRVVAQSVQELFRTGELYFDYLGSTRSDAAFFQGVPNPHFVDSYIYIVDAEMRTRSMFDKSVAEGGYGRPMSPLSAGYENFVRDVIVFYFRRGEIDKAQKMLDGLRTYVHMTLNDPRRGLELSKPVAEFVNDELQDNMTRPSMMVQQVTGALMGAFASGLLGRDPDLFRSQWAFAVQAHKYYMENQLKKTPAAGSAPERMAQIEKNFDRLAGGLFYQFVSTLDVDDAESAYTAAAAKDRLRMYAYGPIREHFKDAVDAAAKNGGRTFDQIFPKPEGFDAFVDELKREMEEEQKRMQGGKVEER
jgi:hypothetical protein